MTILIAEDDPSSRELLAEILTDWGYRLIQAANGAEALEGLRQATPDLILLDLQMPVLDGFAVLEYIRRDPAYDNIPVVALTACAMREDRERALRAGFTDHLAKPVQLDTLRELLERRAKTVRENAALPKDPTLVRTSAVRRGAKMTRG